MWRKPAAPAAGGNGGPYSSRAPDALVTRRTFRAEMPGMLRPDYELSNGEHVLGGIGRGRFACRLRGRCFETTPGVTCHRGERPAEQPGNRNPGQVSAAGEVEGAGLLVGRSRHPGCHGATVDDGRTEITLVLHGAAAKNPCSSPGGEPLVMTASAALCAVRLGSAGPVPHVDGCHGREPVTERRSAPAGPGSGMWPADTAAQVT